MELKRQRFENKKVFYAFVNKSGTAWMPAYQFPLQFQKQGISKAFPINFYVKIEPLCPGPGGHWVIKLESELHT